MSTPMLLYLVLIASCELFQQATCPSIREHKCGLSGHRKPDNYRRRNEQLIKRKDFRRKRIDPFYPWKVLNPEQLWHLRITKPSSRIYWNRTNERCDYLRIRCMKAYSTGAVCARNMDYLYHSFTNYCAMDFHNCVARYDNIWSIAYMGYCTPLEIDMKLYVDMTYDQMSNNSKLKQMYIADLGDETEFEAYATYATFETTVSTTGSTVHYESRKVTDENGTEVTDEAGNFVTELVTVTIPYHYEARKVTNENGTEVTDEEGNFATEFVKVTVPYKYDPRQVTNENGTEVTDEEGNFVTELVRVTVPHPKYESRNVTNENGTEVTDEEGNFATELVNVTVPDKYEPRLITDADGSDVTDQEGNQVTEFVKVTAQGADSDTINETNSTTEATLTTKARL